MGNQRRFLCVLGTSLLFASSALADNADKTFVIPQTGVTFLTGDSWRQAGRRFRLYGVQSCLRGTFYTDRVGEHQDCGAVSTAMLAAFVRDLKPVCAPVVQIAAGQSQPATLLVICTGDVHGKKLDLGATMITQGFAFAAVDNESHPVYLPYLIEEGIAQQARKGLWAFADLPHPNNTLLSTTPMP
ncbi:thermonuclease family protein (plasmid) [Rhizobium sp. CB3060]|uniref:thermonuclease family protein n=1 Tax=Rhizobium sp. CB3060 TaxID=3138255 RepID=UPI0021A266E5|nr:thermonuclease family protein [Rhizobium tropici]UWU26042.1 thermonuclease family protein [Rhizobium tropici]